MSLLKSAIVLDHLWWFKLQMKTLNHTGYTTFITGSKDICRLLGYLIQKNVTDNQLIDIIL